jgi:hypothetical protein
MPKRDSRKGRILENFRSAQKGWQKGYSRVTRLRAVTEVETINALLHSLRHLC